MRNNDLTGKKFGRLTVIKRDEDRIQPSGQHKARWLCKCDCGNPNLISVDGYNLKSGHTKSCGCFNSECASKRHKQYNTYDLSGEYGIGYTNKGEEFYFDLEDYDKIKDYCWRIDNKDHYVVTTFKGKILCFHRIIMNINDSSLDVDHINHVKHNNRKSNLRIVKRNQNASNKTPSNNRVPGVMFRKTKNKWIARITKNYKNIHLGSFNSFEEAVRARKEAEEVYFGEYSYDNYICCNQCTGVCCAGSYGRYTEF